MRFFFKLNVMSCTYAFLLFLHAGSLINVYRLERITNWNGIYKALDWANLAWFAGSLILCYWLSKRLVSGRKPAYAATVLWIPYFILWIWGFSTLFPLTDPGDDPAPVTGLILIFEMILFPFYIALNTFLSAAAPAIRKSMKT
ncbi:hypothetical protein [Paenibacillus sp. XY044]|uniref:hypothetical protein n=1 Tax=Paenibacillus sp. XY044 TaxID=2026089 RepID=UPI000B998290|nr:hypothetical protein [Paenibacillus sp. XY044]OZB98583.1 hypothetical protein CJP46_05415 [Paenibacillus sp. XY044]